MLKAAQVAKDSEPAGFFDVFLEFDERLRKALAGFLGNAADAADVAHDTYEQLFRVWKTTTVQNSKAYLYRTAYRRARILLEKRRRQALGVQVDDAALEEAIDECSPERIAIAEEQLNRVVGILDSKLTAMQRHVLYLRKLEGFSHAEIAEFLHTSPNAVEQLLTQALTRLREHSMKVGAY